MVNSKKLRLCKHNESAQELDIDFSSIPQWKRDLIDIVADLCVKRIKLKMTQEELAQKMGVKQPVVARFEYMGRTPGLESIYKYADGLGVELKPLQFAEEFRIPKPVDDEEDFPSELFAPWQKNVYEIVADLAVYRVKQRVSQAELARRMHTSQSVITRFERMGRIPTIEFIYKVAEALGVELEGLQVRQVQEQSFVLEESSDDDNTCNMRPEFFADLISPKSQCTFIQEMDIANNPESHISIFHQDIIEDLNIVPSISKTYSVDQDNNDDPEIISKVDISEKDLIAA